MSRRCRRPRCRHFTQTGTASVVEGVEFPARRLRRLWGEQFVPPPRGRCGAGWCERSLRSIVGALHSLPVLRGATQEHSNPTGACPRSGRSVLGCWGGNHSPNDLIFDRGSLAEAAYRLDVATARRVAYDLREAADVAERHRRAGWPASAGGLEAS
jgi:hypothetical protein